MSIDEIVKYALKRSMFKAKQMVGRHGFRRDDIEDIQQEIMLDIFQRLPRFNRRRAGIKTFICRLVDNRIAHLIKHREAGCRDHRRAKRSLDDWTHDEDGHWASVGATLTEDAAIDREPLTSCRRIDLALDTVALLNQLSAMDRRLCLKLQAQTVSELSRQTGVVRARIYERLRAIREKFLNAGTADYL